MTKAKLGLKTKITIFIICAVYLPLVTVSIFSETFGELNRTELISKMAKGQVKTELMITKSQQNYMYRTMMDLDQYEIGDIVSDYFKVHKNFKNLKKDPKVLKVLEHAIRIGKFTFPKNAIGYYHSEVYLEDGTSLLTMRRDLISDEKLSDKINIEKFPKISQEKKAEILNYFKNLEPNFVYNGKLKVFKEIRARTYQGVKLVVPFESTKILLITSYLLLPSKAKLTRLVKKEFGEKPGIFIFGNDGRNTIKNENSEDFSMRELLPGAPPSFWSEGIKTYNDPNGNLFVKGEVKSKIRGAEKLTKILYFPNEIIYGPWNFFSNLLIGLIILFAILTVPLLLYFLKKYITPLENILSDLQNSSKTTRKASIDLETTATALAESSLETSSGMENILISMEKINTTQVEIKKEVEMADSLSDENAKVAKATDESNKALITSIDEMSKAAENIGPITDIIEDISFQTNLLSLNASVEAARAGEQGKGFGVVAGSIRELSGKTSESAKDISELISEAIKKSKQGYLIANQNGEILTKIMKNISNVNLNVESISNSLKVQSDSVGPLNEGIDQVHKIFQVSAKNAVACNKISSELGEETKQLEKSIDNLSEILKGKV